MRKPAVVIVSTIVAFVLLPVVSASAVGAVAGQRERSSFPMPDRAAARSAATGVLVAQRATLTAANRMAGQPANPAFAISRADVKVEVLGSPATYFVTGSTLTLSADPPGLGFVELGFGNASGTNCVVKKWFADSVNGPGDRVTTFYGYQENNTGAWDCVVARTGSDYYNDGTTYDVLIGRLTSTYQSPRLSVGNVTLLGQRQKKLKLVKGVKTQVEVAVRNTGPILARNVVVSGKGKRLKVGSGRIDAIRPGESGTATVTVKVKGKKKPGKLSLTASGSGAAGARRIAVKSVKPPKRPVAGSYRDKSGAVTFRIKGGKVVGWRARVQTRCGGYPGQFWYSMNTYDFHKVKIPRNGILQAKQRGSNYGAFLQMKAVGAKVTRGKFNYSGPNRCSAVLGFTAKRVGR